MPERIIPVNVVCVRYFCDVCREVELERTGNVLTIHPPLFEYVCNSCRAKVGLSAHYPQIRYEEVK